jgi:hypothetical protein
MSGRREPNPSRFGPVLAKSPDVFWVMPAKNHLKKSGLNANSMKSTCFFREASIHELFFVKWNEAQERVQSGFVFGF